MSINSEHTCITYGCCFLHFLCLASHSWHNDVELYIFCVCKYRDVWRHLLYVSPQQEPWITPANLARTHYVSICILKASYVAWNSKKNFLIKAIGAWLDCLYENELCTITSREWAYTYNTIGKPCIYVYGYKTTLYLLYLLKNSEVIMEMMRA